MPTIDPIKAACARLDECFARLYPKPNSPDEEKEVKAYYRELSKQRSGEVN